MKCSIKTFQWHVILISADTHPNVHSNTSPSADFKTNLYHDKSGMYKQQRFICFDLSNFAQLARAVGYTDCTSADGVRQNECPGYDTKQSDGEVPVMLELWEMWSTPSLPLLPGPHWPSVVAPDRALSMG